AMLIEAHRLQAAGPLQSRLLGQQRVLALALPVQSGEQTIAIAYVELPYAPLQEAFRRQRAPDVRMDLRQGDGHGDLLIDSIGSSGTDDTLGDTGTPIPESLFRIASRPRQ